MALSPDGKTLYVAVGGNTNAGAPSNNFAGLPEFAYAAAVLKAASPFLVKAQTL